MPIYEYQCELCNFKDDLMLKVSDAIQLDCPSCGKTSFSKQVSAPAFKLNGSGWYATDFKNVQKPKDEKKSERNTVKKTEGENNA